MDVFGKMSRTTLRRAGKMGQVSRGEPPSLPQAAGGPGTSSAVRRELKLELKAGRRPADLRRSLVRATRRRPAPSATDAGRGRKDEEEKEIVLSFSSQRPADQAILNPGVLTLSCRGGEL